MDQIDRPTGLSRRRMLQTGAVGAAAFSLPLDGALFDAAEARPRLGRVLAHDLAVPWGIDFLPGGGALVGERDTGRVVRVGRHGGKHLVDRLSVFSQKSRSGESGLLGLALSPHFRRNRWVYAYLSTRSDNRIVRMRYHDGRLGKRHLVLAGIPMNLHHNGGGLAFGPGGLLFASTGDAEDGSRSQDKHSLGGKILRMTPDGGVPRGNPFGNHTWSYGHRNVEGLSFDHRGRLWASEFGESYRDELNHIVKGGNYGWPFLQGRDGRGGYHDPLAQWPTDHCSPSGLAVANGHAWLGALQGHCLWSVRLNGPHRGRKKRWFGGRLGRIRLVKAAPGGDLWVATSNRDGRGTPSPHDDRIFRIRLP